MALLLVIIFGRIIIGQQHFLIFDTIGLALFVVVGIQKTIAADFPFWIAIIMGTITGAAGGVLRDILINEVPLIFRKEIYAMACVFGGIVYWICYRLDYAPHLTQVLAALTVIATRIRRGEIQTQFTSPEGR